MKIILFSMCICLISIVDCRLLQKESLPEGKWTPCRTGRSPPRCTGELEYQIQTQCCGSDCDEKVLELKIADRPVGRYRSYCSAIQPAKGDENGRGSDESDNNVGIFIAEPFDDSAEVTVFEEGVQEGSQKGYDIGRYEGAFVDTAIGAVGGVSVSALIVGIVVIYRHRRSQVRVSTGNPLRQTGKKAGEIGIAAFEDSELDSDLVI